MEKQNLTLPEWAFLDTDNQTGNELKGRDVLLHVRTHTMLEFFYDKKDGFKINPEVKQQYFMHKNSYGVQEPHIVVVHYSLVEFTKLDDVIKKAIEFYCNWIDWMDGTIELEETSKHN